MDELSNDLSSDLPNRMGDVIYRLKCAPLYAPSQAEGFDNPAWEDASFRVLILRLSPWQDARRSTAHLFLHSLLRSTLGATAYGDFAFFPSAHDRGILDREALPWISGIASRRTMEAFDAVLISCSYALELVNLPLLLLKSDLPLRSGRRRAAFPDFPPLILGGSNAMASQGAIFPDGDSFVDGIYFGEAEAGAAALLSVLASSRGKPIGQRLADLESAVPAFWACTTTSADHQAEAEADGVAENRVEDGRMNNNRSRKVYPGRSRCGADSVPFLPASYPILNSEEAGTLRLQLSWGCPSFCTFCCEGWERKPYREVPMERILALARDLAKNTGATTAELYSFNFNAHRDSLELIKGLHGIFDRVNMMSQRADILIKTRLMVECELAAEKRSYTIGVEGVSQRMRDFYAKDLRTDQLWELLEKLIKERVREIKLFFIIAGIETETDLEEFNGFCQKLKEKVNEQHRGPRFVLSAGYLVRMPFTPLRAMALELDRKKLSNLSDRLKLLAEASELEFRMAMDWEEYLADQLLMAGSYALAEGLEEAALGGIVYDGGIQGALSPYLVKALQRSGELDRPDAAAQGPSGPLSGPLVREKPMGWTYPLAFIEPEVSDRFLEEAYEAAKTRQPRPGCFGRNDGDGECGGCGACGDDAERTFLTGHRITPAPGLSFVQKIDSLVKEKRKSQGIHLRVRIPRRLSGWEGEYLSALAMREVLTREENLVGKLFRIEEALWNCGAWEKRLGKGVAGETVLVCYGIGGKTPLGEPCLEDQAAERISAALGQAWSGRVERMDVFQPEKAVPAQVRIEWDTPTEADALRRVRDWLGALSLAYTERKASGVEATAAAKDAPEDSFVPSRSFLIAPKAKKKRSVETAELSFRQGPGGPRTALLRIEGGAKLDLGPLFPKESDKARMTIAVEELRFPD